MAIEHLPPPGECRSVRAALAAAGRLPLERVVVIGEAADGLVVFSAEADHRMTAKTMLWLLESAKTLLMGR